MNSCIYNGIVSHRRFKPVKHSLNYKTFSLLLDLDEIESLAKKITQQIKVPTIGIGASKECDGQILVIDDIIGISNFRPKFVKKYSNIGLIIEKSVKQYCQEVKKQKFPGIKYVYKN